MSKSKKQEVITINQASELVSNQPASLVMLQTAIEKGMDPDKLLQFYEIHAKWERNEARKAYVKAMSEFKKTAIVIIKDSTVEYTTDKGTTTYNHASLFNVVSTITKNLANFGLAHRWETNQGEGGRITVTCIITHELGHSEETALTNSPDASGGKNNIQAVGSTVTYLERYTLLALSGIATKEQDDDGVKSLTKADYLQVAIKRLQSSISVICDGLDSGEFDKAVEARMELSNDEISSINIAPTKARELGVEPPFTTEQIAKMRSEEWSAEVRRYYADKK